MRTVFRFVATVLTFALLAPVVEGGAVLADDLRDMLADSTGLADNPDTPGPDLYAPLHWDDGIPDMPSLIVLDEPTTALVFVSRPAAAARVHESLPSCPARVATREISNRGPPAA
jgi:hypothetical protein